MTSKADPKEAPIFPWREVTPIERLNGEVEAHLDRVDTLRKAWEDAMRRGTREEFDSARQRSLRRHAIETGIIERLYDVDWGVTEALVAEGLTLEIAEREGGVSPQTLAVIQSQFEALRLMAESAREGRDISAFLIRELHTVLTRHQASYEATDALGRQFQAELHHGVWKTQPNHVHRQDGLIMEYTPPAQVQPQIDRLIEIGQSMAEVHPVIRAAWLHHRFICIHPFEDGNGRVARALVLLVLLRANYAPLVVDRTRRLDYLRALDLANDADLSPLVKLFAELEVNALRSELERPLEPSHAAGAVGVAKAYVHRLRERRVAQNEKHKAMAERLAHDIHLRLQHHLRDIADELCAEFRSVDKEARATFGHGAPPDAVASYWKVQLVRSARQVGFYANLANGSWWVRLHLLVLGETLRYVVAIQRVGYEDNGVLAVTVFAEVLHSKATEDEAPGFPTPALNLTTADSVTLVAEDTSEARWPDVAELIDRTLAAAVDFFGSQLG